MSELSPLIVDLALILVTAGIFSLLFKWLRQPVVLAYIVAGIVLSFFITPDDPQYENIETWAEIGIIFLLFGLGLEFNFKKLLAVGQTAFIATIFIVVCMIGVGYFAGILFGWSHITSLFLGAMLSMSSTMIIIKVFDDLNLNNKSFSGIVLGIIILAALLAVLLMVLLSTIAVSQNFEGQEMLFSLFKLISFLLFWFLLGTYLIPTFLRKMKRFLNNETLLILCLALCLGMVFLAVQFGFSAALGAFMMGSILSETLDSERINAMISPIKDFFGAIFFVSVGLMIQVASLGAYIVPILIISLIVIVGQIIFATSGVLLAGQNLKTALFSGFSLTQIGEFSYIIGGLGISLGVIENSLYQIVVSSSIITIFLTPYMIKSAAPVYNWVDKKLPPGWRNFVDREISGAHPINQEKTWKILIKEITFGTVFYFLISIVIIYFSFQFGVPVLEKYLPGFYGKVLSAFLIILFIAPFLRMIIIQKDRSKEFKKLWKGHESYKAPLIFTIVFRVILCIGLIMYVLITLFHPQFVLALLVATLLLLFFLTSKRLKKETMNMEKRFEENLNEKERYDEAQAIIPKGFEDHVLERDLHLSDFIVKPEYSIVGKTLKELDFRQYFGVNIVSVIRDNIRKNIPHGGERIYPHDHLVVLGTDKQMDLFQQRIQEKNNPDLILSVNEENNVEIKQLEIESHSSLIGKTIKTSCIQENYDCLIVGLERNNNSILNPEVDLLFEKGDILWLVGEYRNIKKIENL
ncbi:MAG: cation:proton antiporter [Bacteroidales bacterium]|nr:cation:proton antiporter [Bacteroidales bacterium]